MTILTVAAFVAVLSTWVTARVIAEFQYGWSVLAAVVSNSVLWAITAWLFVATLTANGHSNP